MAFPLKRRIYESLPLWLKRSVHLVPFSLLAGRAYRRTLARDQRFDRASRDEIRSYQARHLGAMLRFATDQVPVYRHLRGAVERLDPFDALKEFPLLDKDAIQQDMARYLPRDFDSIPHYEVSTGGTSGNQLKMYLNDESQAVEIAFLHRYWRRVGYTPNCRKATFRGVAFGDLREGVFWQHNPIYNELQFSPFHMHEGTLGAYVEQIVAFKATYFHGYPSALDILAEYVIRNDLVASLPTIRAALVASEACMPGQRERIERAFGTRVYSSYGHSERLIFGGECEHTTAYHHFPDYGILEIVDESGRPCDEPGQRGELVGTGLLNRSMPLIRYQTGDFATRIEHRCRCGRCWDRFDRVEGRWKQEMLIGHGGARISLTALNMHGPLFERVVRYQYVQDTPGACELRLMVAPGFAQRDRLAIASAYHDKVGQQIDVEVCIVDDIPLTARGKLKRLQSSLDPAQQGIPAPPQRLQAPEET